ncbi:MAG: alpha/beta fold hydrolase [Phycisphaeraceae bacterium]|nr:MAG: alpha/beta fold hydrolase [Phycisphaeraceae bacterium]
MSRNDDEPRTERPRRKRRSIWFRLARILVLFAIVLIGVKITGVGERLFYWPTRDQYAAPTGAEDVFFYSDGHRLHGWFLPAVGVPPGEKAPTIVHCHGNAANISRHLVFVDFLPREGFNVLIFDYRSYGRSEKGPLNREGLIHDAEAAVDYVMQRPDVDPDRVGIYGLSLGGTIALAAAADDERVAAVCSIATFSTWKGVTGDYLPVIGPWLTRPGYDAVDSVAKLGDRPLLLLHGTKDPIVSPRHAPIIEAAARDAGVNVTFKSIEGADHVNWIDSHPEMWRAIVAFFKEHLGRS